MAKDTFYFSHDYNARSDKELMRLRMKMGMTGVGIFWCIVEMLYEEDGHLLRSEYERISFELRVSIEEISAVIEGYDLFKKDEEKFWSESVLRRLKTRKDKSDKARQSISYRWGNTNVLEPNNDSNTIKERKGKENNKGNRTASPEKGIRFDEKLTKVFFSDGSSQKLGDSQKFEAERGTLNPRTVIKGSCY